MVTTVGRPEAVYHDRHGIFVRARQERESVDEQLAGDAGADPGGTGVGGPGDRLTLRPLAAGQGAHRAALRHASGSVGGGLGLAGATTLAEANVVLAAYLPRFNARFAVPAVVAALAWRPLEAAERSLADLLLTLCAHRGSR